MQEHELFISLLTDSEIIKLAKGRGIRPDGFGKMKNIPIQLLKNTVKTAFAKGHKNASKGYNLYKVYEDYGTSLIQKKNMPKLKGQELLEECGNRVEIPDGILLSYLYVCDKDLYHEKVQEWCKNRTEGGRLFQDYSSANPDEQLVKLFTTNMVIKKQSIIEKAKSLLKNVELPPETPEKITAEHILNFNGEESQAIKMLYIYLTDNENKDNPLAKQLWLAISSWVTSKELELVNANQHSYKEEQDKLEKEVNKKNKDNAKLKEKLDKLMHENIALKSANDKRTNDLRDVNKKLVKKENEVATYIKEKDKLTKNNSQLEEKLNELLDVFNLSSIEDIIKQYKDSAYKAELLTLILPNAANYMIVTTNNLVKLLPTFIKEECITDIDCCMQTKWCEGNIGKTLYLHRQAFGTAKHFEEAMNFTNKNSLNAVEVNALDESEWLKELIRKEVDS